MKNSIIFLFLLIISCQQEPKTSISPWVPYDETEELAKNAIHESPKMRYKLIQSKNLDKNELWESIEDQISDFSEDDYLKFK